MVRRATTDNSVSYHLQPCKRKNRELTTLRLMGGILLYKIAILSQSKQLKDRCHDNLGYLPGVLFCPTPPRRWTILEDIQEQWLLCQIFLLFAAYQNLIFEIPHGRPFWAKNLSIPSFFAWKLLGAYILTTDYLRKRGCFITNCCPLCPDNNESSNHLSGCKEREGQGIKQSVHWV